MAKVWMPGTPATLLCTSGKTWKALRLRWFHGLRPSPQKPPPGKVIWKVNLVSGICSSSLFTARVDWVTCSMVELEGVLTTPKITPWSSAGASSLGDCANIASASRLTTAQAT